MHRIKFILAVSVLILISVACSTDNKSTSYSCFDGKVLVEVEVESLRSGRPKSDFIISFFSTGTYTVKFIYDKDAVSSISDSEFDVEFKETDRIRKVVIPVKFHVFKTHEMRVNIAFKEFGKDSVLFEEKYFGPDNFY